MHSGISSVSNNIYAQWYFYGVEQDVRDGGVEPGAGDPGGGAPSPLSHSDTGHWKSWTPPRPPLWRMGAMTTILSPHRSLRVLSPPLHIPEGG